MQKLIFLEDKLLIEHIAIWTQQLEVMKDFYVRYFSGTANDKYVSPKGPGVNFESYFLSFDKGARLELMQMSTIPKGTRQQAIGYAHIAFGLESEEAVCALTKQLKADGYTIAGEPRRTGDGYFESSVYDPDGNLVEISALR
jgi:catechol 2,3-dioxygenase-like lactoylglutathione lyase family enzyme